MSTDPSFPQLFREYYAIHETIHAILSETGGRISADSVARLVRARHPELQMRPSALVQAIEQAISDTRGR